MNTISADRLPILRSQQAASKLSQQAQLEDGRKRAEQRHSTFNSLGAEIAIGHLSVDVLAGLIRHTDWSVMLRAKYRGNQPLIDLFLPPFPGRDELFLARGIHVADLTGWDVVDLIDGARGVYALL
jgi:hypothetical protein